MMEQRKSDSEKVKQIIDDIEEDEGLVDNDILKIAAQDVEVSPHETSRLQAAKDLKPTSFYSDLIYTLAHIRMNEIEARVTWSDIIAHKAEMGQAMKRKVGIRVAALDYFSDVKKMVDNVRIVDAEHYIETKRLVVTDSLTGLFNHRYFYEKLSILHRQLQNELISSIGLMVVDLDYFKQYNDTNGHIAGDIVLMEVANVFNDVVDKLGTVFRYGGEEFTVLIPEIDIKPFESVAESIRAGVEEKDFVNEEVMPGGDVTVSIGLSILPDICGDAKHFFQSADEALYLAKKLGRNRVETAEG